jgi:membrane protease YdiL (CAAX protease family)
MQKLKATTWLDLVWLFGIPTILNSIACQIAIPRLDSLRIFPIEVTYFLSVGLLVLVPMFCGAIYLTGREVGSYQLHALWSRMRIKRLSGGDWAWTVGAFMLLSVTSFLIAKVIMPKIGMDATPFFFQNMPLTDGYWWILSVWPIFFFFNILGEEFWWRGYIQPRQELLQKNWTWFVHGVLWACWHLPMGLDLIIAAIPILLILPAIVQYRKNTTIAIIVHTVFGGFGFLVLALGGVH